MFVPMSPGDCGGSQYIHSPMVPASARDSSAAAAGAHLPLARPALFPLLFMVCENWDRWVATFLTRPKPRGQKTIHIVRHGESEYNAACAAPGSSWEEPAIFDAALTPLGHAQSVALGSELAQVVSADALWVTSPLTRAIQTCVLVRPRKQRTLRAAH